MAPSGCLYWNSDWCLWISALAGLMEHAALVISPVFWEVGGVIYFLCPPLCSVCRLIRRWRLTALDYTGMVLLSPLSRCWPGCLVGARQALVHQFIFGDSRNVGWSRTNTRNDRWLSDCQSDEIKSAS